VEYFNAMYAILSDTNAVRNIYEYFKTLPGVSVFNSIPIPQSEYQKSMVELSMSPIQLFVKQYAETGMGSNKMPPGQLFDLFNQWKIDTKIGFDISALKFSVQLSRLGIDGITNGKSNGSRYIEMNCPKILEFLEKD
jgi:hypothetical protein